MSKITKILSVIFTLALSFNSLVAQKTLEAGVIKIEITDVKADDPQQAMMLESMKGSETVINFKGKQSAVAMSMMGGMINMKINTDPDANKFDMLMDAMGQKMWIESPLDASVSPEEKEKASKAIVEYDKSKTKEIAGYKCFAFSIKNEESGDINGYMTSDIKANNNIQGYQSLKLDGFPMEYTVSNEGFSMTMSAKEISDKVDESAFVLDTKGYKKMTMDEFKAMMGGAGF